MVNSLTTALVSARTALRIVRLVMIQLLAQRAWMGSSTRRLKVVMCAQLVLVTVRRVRIMQPVIPVMMGIMLMVTFVWTTTVPTGHTGTLMRRSAPLVRKAA